MDQTASGSPERSLSRPHTAPGRFAALPEALHRATRQVAVLVDEYDKPILDPLVETPEVARTYVPGLLHYADREM